MSVYFCQKCNHSFSHSPIGRTPRFCSSACRQANYRQQRALRNAPLVVDDLLIPLRNVAGVYSQVDWVEAV